MCTHIYTHKRDIHLQILSLFLSLFLSFFLSLHRVWWCLLNSNLSERFTNSCGRIFLICSNDLLIRLNGFYGLLIRPNESFICLLIELFERLANSVERLIYSSERIFYLFERLTNSSLGGIFFYLASLHVQCCWHYCCSSARCSKFCKRAGGVTEIVTFISFR